MKNKISITCILIVAFALFLNGCSANKTGKLPAGLVTIEAQAEDIIDVAPGGDWKTIATDIVAISKAWKTYQPQATKDGATQAMLDSFDSALAALQGAATAQDKTGTMQASNDISAVVVDLFDLYHPAIPADVGRLDVLERQVVLDTAAGNFTAVSANLEKIDKIWRILKPSILAHNGEETAKQFEESLSIQSKALEAKDIEVITSEAKNALEIVDALEQLY